MCYKVGREHVPLSSGQETINPGMQVEDRNPRPDALNHKAKQSPLQVITNLIVTTAPGAAGQNPA